MAREPTDLLREQIELALTPYGYFKPHLTFSKNARHIHISPGPQIHISALTISVHGEGENNPALQKALHECPLAVGQPFNSKRYEDTKDVLFSTAENEGYLHATFKTAEVLIDRQQYTVKITLQLNTGPQYYFGQVRFDPARISPKLLQRYVPFRYGQTYSTEQILALNTNLTDSGYFSSVNIKPNLDAKPNVPVDVNLKPVSRVNYSLGGGYGTDTGPRGVAALQVVPVNQYGHKFNALIQGSFTENTLQARYTIPGQNPMIDKYSLGGALSTLNYSSGYSNSLLLSAAQQHILSNYQRLLSINQLVERFHYTDQSKLERSLLFPKAVLTWSKTTSPLFSPSGYNVSINGLAASKAFLSQINLAQAAIDAKMAVSVEAIRTRFYLHGLQGVTQIKSVDQIPLSLAQLLGGPANMKGYSYNALGPGKMLTYGGVELQKETFKKWYLLGFVDAGNVYKPSRTIFKYDIGIGLMWVSPIGPIKVGVGQPVNHRLSPLAESSPKLVINMGPDL
jgi:translocation and assembly module TamA